MPPTSLSAQEIEQTLARLKDIVIKHKAADAPLAVETVTINGVELDVFARVPDNLRGIYALGLDTPEKTFLVYEEERYTFGQCWEIASDVANALINEYGIGKGDRVAICSRNYPEWCLAYMATTMMGAIVVPMNSWWQTEELAYGLKDSGTRVLFADQERIDTLVPVLDGLDLSVIAIKAKRPETIERFSSFSQLVENGRNGARHNLSDIEILPEDDASIMYTSGSTGLPKGVLSTHRAIVNALYSWLFGKHVMEELKPELVEENPEFQPALLANVPLFHVTGSHAQFLASFLTARKFVMLYKWDADKALELIEKERISVLHGVPTMTWEVMNSPKFDRTDLRSLRSVQSGGAARPPEHLTLMQKKFPKEALPGLGYGLTETNAIGATISGEFYIAKPMSTGRPTQPVTSIKIVDESGRPLGANEVGEICIKGPTIMKGYWKKPKETAEVLKDGWFHTGDIGRLDEHGFLVIMDRAKDIVIRGGENIACAEVEYALAEHPAVSEASVFALPDDRLGEVPAAAVMVTAGYSVTKKDLQEFLSGRIARFKVPAQIWIQDTQLPRLATGKIAKKHIQQEMLARYQQA